MSRVGLVSTWVVCGLAAAGTAWFGFASGLFRLRGIGLGGLVASLAPYLALALLAWGQRRHPVSLGVTFGLAVAAAGYGLFLYVNDWYWPRPTYPNPWRVWMIPVVALPQWAVIGSAAVTLAARHLWSTCRKASAG